MTEKPWEIQCDRCLVVPDIHLDVAWAQAILEREAGNYDHVVLLGDIYDSYWTYPRVVSYRAAARFHREMIERPDCTVLLGNHCAPMMESWSHARKFGKKIPLLNPCSGFTSHHAIDVSKELDWEHWRKVRLFKVVNGFALSHAGIAVQHFRPSLSIEENFAALWDEADSALELIQFNRSPLLACGYSRGGDSSVPGLTWQDWSIDFWDELGVPQLVGHSHAINPRQKGSSFCIDTGQKSYALISRDGKLEIKNLVRTAVSGTWVEEPVQIDVQ